MKRPTWYGWGAAVLLILAFGGLLLFWSRLEARPPAGLLQATPISDSPAPSVEPRATLEPLPSPTAVPIDPWATISRESLLADVERLAAIQAYSGWRNSASQGEAEALYYVAATLEKLEHISGMELERESFRVFLGTELWESRLELTVNGREFQVPANGLRGPRDQIAQALRFDSDGTLNDSNRDPETVEGPVVVIRSAAEIDALTSGSLKGEIVFLDYAAVDRLTQKGSRNAAGVAANLLSRGPAALVLVTAFSNELGKSHGTFVGDSGVLDNLDAAAMPPTLYTRLEDLRAAGIESWEDLPQIQAARLVWDADLFSPANSGNLVARIPGKDSSQAVILGAHIDSANSPGAMDDGSGAAILIEIARVLDASQLRPPIDLVLAWFGSEELGLYGSSHFAATHQDLLDRTVGMLQIDGLTHPLTGIAARLTLVARAVSEDGEPRLPWPDHLAAVASRRDLQVSVEAIAAAYSDNSSFDGLDVPNADLIYLNEPAMEATGSLHYAAHIHDPYDTIEMAREMGDVLEEMAKVALCAALEPTAGASTMRSTPRPEHRALFVASHTEPVHMTPAFLTGLGVALAWEGFDVDVIPYGQEVTAADLENSSLVIALPVVDYPQTDGNPALYDQAWGEQEVAALETYAANGGLLVLTGSAHRLKGGNSVLERNEDWEDMNAIAQRVGVTYEKGILAGSPASAQGLHPLVKGLTSLSLASDNGVPFRLAETVTGQVLATLDAQPVMALVDHGRGQVLILSDLGMLGSGWQGPDNRTFWQNLAHYARR